MENTNPMKLLLLEDSVKDCRNFMDYVKTRLNDVVLVGMTGRSSEAIQLVKHKMPEAVIVDLDLDNGEGSGYDFLEEFYSTEFKLRPICVVTTLNHSSVTREYLNAKYDIATIFYKKQKGYCPEMVVRHLLRFREVYYSQANGDIISSLKTPESPEEFERRVYDRIKAELDAIGMSIRYKGRKSAEEAIYTLAVKDYGDDERIFNELAKKHNMHYNNFTRNIQNAINKVWNTPGDVEILLKHYTAPVSSKNGSPTPTEFIHYYADLIRRDIS